MRFQYTCNTSLLIANLEQYLNGVLTSFPGLNSCKHVIDKCLRSCKRVNCTKVINALLNFFNLHDLYICNNLLVSKGIRPEISFL